MLAFIMNALPIDVPAEILRTLVQRPPSEAGEFRVSLTKFIVLLDGLSTAPEISPGLTRDELQQCIELLNAIVAMFEGATIRMFRVGITALAPDMLDRFDRATVMALSGARAHVKAIEDALETLRRDRVRKAHAQVANEHRELFRRLAK